MKQLSSIMFAVLSMLTLPACDSGGGGRGGGHDLGDTINYCEKTLNVGWAYNCDARTQRCTTEFWVKGGASYVVEFDITNGGITESVSYTLNQDPIVFRGEVPCGVSVGYLVKWKGSNHTMCPDSRRYSYSTPDCPLSGRIPPPPGPAK